MDRDFRRGHLEIDFPTQPFDSPLALLRDSVRVFLSNLPFLRPSRSSFIFPVS
jgi:hypothetical protein